MNIIMFKNQKEQNIKICFFDIFKSYKFDRDRKALKVYCDKHRQYEYMIVADN